VGGRWEHYPHDADMGIRGTGESLAEAFANAALALTGVVVDAALVRPREAVDIACEHAEAEGLLYDWLNAVVYEMATRRCLFSRFEVQVEGARLRARAWGEAVDVERHRPAVEVKAATYTGLRVHRGPEGAWVAECVVDV
jgi:SHS2 domain-containing protein